MPNTQSKEGNLTKRVQTSKGLRDEPCAKQGHEVRLIPALVVRPFVKSSKNDYRNAEAIAEVVDRETMRFVPIKTENQLDLQALH